ncbi:hypothetical protein NVP1081O_133 [Vibrio phage 1.081.O._10N.286.52.C2]|nr:hypothetical protein NVP1081O_133 [Vibrio phage 1.081.O._10N.286.52.C2]
MKSTMFLQNISVIDHAYVCDEGKINGMSYNLCVEITGEVDETEQVVIDFSGCKKAIKNLVDESEHAIDHKLVIIDGYSKAHLDTVENRDRTKITSPEFIAVASVEDWFKVVENITMFEDKHQIPSDVKYMNYLTQYLEDMLVEQLRALGYPVTEVLVELSEKFDLPSWANAHAEFNYAHGLRSSTSYGCQNIAHGHRSFIAVDVHLGTNGRKVLKRIAEEMTGYFAWSENIRSDDGAVSYTSQRGNFHLQIQDPIIIPTETTVENLTAFIADKYMNELQDMGVERLWVSEGLSKGAVINIPLRK